jgi:hypothetical protein
MANGWLKTGLTLIFAVCVTGCGEVASGPKTATVSGTVTLDGEPLESGSISFAPVDGIGPSAGEKITDGTYTANVPLGEKRVLITSPKVVGQRKTYEGVADSPTVPIYKELVPARYNAQSELKTTITSGKNPGDFILETPGGASKTPPPM